VLKDHAFRLQICEVRVTSLTAVWKTGIVFIAAREVVRSCCWLSFSGYSPTFKILVNLFNFTTLFSVTNKASNDRVLSEGCIAKDLEGSSSDLILRYYNDHRCSPDNGRR
jgi:hypothetical protein